MPEVNFRCIIFLCSALPLYALPRWDRSSVLSYPLSLGIVYPKMIQPSTQKLKFNTFNADFQFFAE